MLYKKDEPMNQILGVLTVGALILGPAFILNLFFDKDAEAQIGTQKIIQVQYSHSTVGTTAQDAILAASVEKEVKAWKICHDAGSASVYLAVSDGVDPDTDGARLEAGQCFDCMSCSFATLRDANVKGSAAGTGYSVIQYR